MHSLGCCTVKCISNTNFNAYVLLHAISFPTMRQTLSFLLQPSLKISSYLHVICGRHFTQTQAISILINDDTVFSIATMVAGMEWAPVFKSIFHDPRRPGCISLAPIFNLQHTRTSLPQAKLKICYCSCLKKRYEPFIR